MHYTDVTWTSWHLITQGIRLVFFQKLLQSNVIRNTKALLRGESSSGQWILHTKTQYWEKRLTHWGRVTHICVSKLTINGSDNGLSPGWRQAIIWPNAGILLIGALGTNVSEILIKIDTFSLKKMLLKMSSGKKRSSCLGLNVLNVVVLTSFGSPAVNSHNEWIRAQSGALALSAAKVYELPCCVIWMPMYACVMSLKHTHEQVITPIISFALFIHTSTFPTIS